MNKAEQYQQALELAILLHDSEEQAIQFLDTPTHVLFDKTPNEHIQDGYGQTVIEWLSELVGK